MLSFYCDLCILAHSVTLWVVAKTFSHQITTLLSPSPETPPFSENSNETDMEIRSTAIPPNVDIPDNRNTVITLIEMHVDRNFRSETDSIGRTWKMINGSFKSIRHLSDTINKAIGSQVVLFMVEGIMHYSIYLNGWLRSHDFYWRIIWTLFYMVTCGVLLISADICNQVNV